ncbi:MAG: urease accessory protein UreD [Pseudomonadota bacterium]
MRVLFPNAPAADVPHAVLVTTSGGMVGGDRLDIAVEAGRDAKALVTTQAAEKIYRSSGATSHLTATVHARRGAWLEWLPQETILFDAARLRRTTSVRLERDARVLAGEILVFGRHAHGEALKRGLLQDRWHVRSEDRLIWADSTRLDGDVATRLAAPFGFAGAAASATLIYAGPDASALRDPLRELIGESDSELRCGATALPDLLVCRWLARDAARLRLSFGQVWAGFRCVAAALPKKLPATWHC